MAGRSLQAGRSTRLCRRDGLCATVAQAAARVLAGVVLLPLLAACGGEPARTAMESPMLNDTFQLNSPAFAEGGAIPAKFTCDGQDVSPALSWVGAPDDTSAFVVVVDDPDANGFVHWVLFNLTGSQSGSLTEAVSESPDAPAQGRNDFGGIGWSGPCPPAGRPHTYRFSLLALDAPLELSGTPSATEVRDAAEGHVLATARLTATYQRNG